jgi:molybdopterin converting factor small subunit
MRVAVRFHAELARFAPEGAARTFASLSEASRVTDLLAMYPALAQRRIVIGVNGQLASADAELHDGDAVDLLTQMSGGALVF